MRWTRSNSPCLSSNLESGNEDLFAKRKLFSGKYGWGNKAPAVGVGGQEGVVYNVILGWCDVEDLPGMETVSIPRGIYNVYSRKSCSTVGFYGSK